MASKTKNNPVIPFLRDSAAGLAQPLLAVVFGLLVGAVVIALTGENIFVVYKAMFHGGFGTPFYFLATLTRATPIIFCALGASMAWRAGYYNIGGEGQLIVGGFCTAVSALYLPISGVLGLLVALFIGTVCGGLYALLAAWLNNKFNVVLVICTLMFNYIANYLAFYFVSFPLKDVTGDGLVAKTLQIDPSMWIPRLGWVKGSPFHYGFFIAVAVAALVLFITKKTVFGYESRMSGLNRNFAEYGGVKRTRTMYITMFLSGMLCAMGGAVEVLGLKHVYMHDMLTSPSYAWTGLMAALISGLNPIGIVVCSIFLAGIQTGGAALERTTNVPLQLTMVIQAVITLFVSAKIMVRVYQKRKAAEIKQITDKENAQGGAKDEH